MRLPPRELPVVHTTDPAGRSCELRIGWDEPGGWCVLATDDQGDVRWQRWFPSRPSATAEAERIERDLTRRSLDELLAGGPVAAPAERDTVVVHESGRWLRWLTLTGFGGVLVRGEPAGVGSLIPLRLPVGTFALRARWLVKSQYLPSDPEPVSIEGTGRTLHFVARPHRPPRPARADEVRALESRWSAWLAC